MKKIYTKEEIIKRRAAQTRATRAERSHKIKHDWTIIYEVIWDNNSNNCFYCKNPIDKNAKFSYELDHKIPIIRGGTNNKDNLCIACPRCNGTKMLMTDVEFFKCIDDLKKTGNWD